ncbi:hypothetical protein Pan258_00310 [Symmachiella dynata]|uniref:CbrC family protein n=1 Tax=Symmachiella dynata TaxID=2527995 RepID=UPI00118CA30F|nr:hypothetical protein Pan258_00310 [Symmachiella dynata]
MRRCDWCQTESSLYRINIENSQGFSDSACINCIKTLPLRWIYPKDNERIIAQLIDQRFPKGTKSQSQRFAFTVELCDDYRRTPCLPNFIQNDDWPHCCGDFTEFIGDAGTTFTGLYNEFDWWGHQDDMAREYGIEQLIDGEDRISLFKCLHCLRKFWTCQYT